jgi:hypothetical protein
VEATLRDTITKEAAKGPLRRHRPTPTPNGDARQQGRAQRKSQAKEGGHEGAASASIFGFFLLFQRFSLARHHAPTAGQIEVRSSKQVIV